MTTRAEQREQTRARIVAAALEAFADQGFDGTSTRDIAARAEVTQGLVTYHFETKDDLWRAAADHLFEDVFASLPDDFGDLDGADELTRNAVRAGVRLAARRPELFRFMIDSGRRDDERMRWLIEAHLDGFFSRFEQLVGERQLAAHLYYAVAGAASLLFVSGPECAVLTGMDTTADETIERHAELLAELFVP
ncbi:MAG: helix-turn-helix domain-containing protein [Actinomycetota bacterium]